VTAARAQCLADLPESRPAVVYAKDSGWLAGLSGRRLVESPADPTFRLSRAQAAPALTPDQLAQQELVDLINDSRNLYEVLGVERWADGAEMRRSYMQRCRSVHPECVPARRPPGRVMREAEPGADRPSLLNPCATASKFPKGHESATTAFQKLSYAYSVLSKPASKRQYDASPSSLYSNLEGSALNPFNFSWQGEDGDQAVADTNAQETFTQVLLSIWTDFIDGDFQAIRVIISASPPASRSLCGTRATVSALTVSLLAGLAGGLNLGPDTVESMEGVFRRLRDLMLSGQRYTRVVQFEIIRLYEIQQALRALRWLDIRGRMRLGLQLTRVVVLVYVPQQISDSKARR